MSGYVHKTHSALSGRGGVAPTKKEVDNVVYYNDRMSYFIHDVCDPHIPREFYKANCIYSEPSWAAGYKKFTENSIAEDTSFSDYLEGIRNICETTGLPAFILCGIASAKRMNAPRIHECKWDGGVQDAVYAVFNYDGELPSSSTEELKKFLGEQFECALDFSAGYGAVSYGFKKCIFSDINTGCRDWCVEHFGLTEKREMET